LDRARIFCFFLAGLAAGAAGLAAGAGVAFFTGEALTAVVVFVTLVAIALKIV
jgi:hypothetical protein